MIYTVNINYFLNNCIKKIKIDIFYYLPNKFCEKSYNISNNFTSGFDKSFGNSFLKKNW